MNQVILFILQIQCQSGIFLESFASGRFTWLLCLMNMVELWEYVHSSLNPTNWFWIFYLTLNTEELYGSAITDSDARIWNPYEISDVKHPPKHAIALWTFLSGLYHNLNSDCSFQCFCCTPPMYLFAPSFDNLIQYLYEVKIMFSRMAKNTDVFPTK